MNRLACSLFAATLATASPSAHAAGLSRGGYEHVIEIELPPGPRGTQPELRLVADHSVGDGLLGHGWRLDGLSRIERVSATEGTPAMDSSDLYRVDGELLVDEPGTTLARVPQSAPDRRFTWMTVSGSHTFWTAKQDGWTWTWGGKAHPWTSWSRAFEWQAEGENASCDGAPGSVTGITAWHLSSVQDPSGNRIEYEYGSPCTGSGASAGGLAHPAWERYPTKIRYNEGQAEVRFNYELRPDVRAQARGGRVRASAWRLSRVEVFGLSGVKVGRYDLHYADEVEGGACAGEDTSA